MECREVQELLSAYYDRELSPDLQSAVADHVQSCSRCSDELVVFEEMSTVARKLDDPDPPPQMWAGIEAALDVEQQEISLTNPATKPGRFTPRRWLGLLSTAAALMLATGVVWIAGRAWHSAEHHGDIAATFSHYIEQFPESPELAQNVLLAKFDGQAVNMSRATRQLGYRPAVADGLPAGYSLEAVYVLDMPCCRCVQSICRRDDGRLFALFEHDEAEPGWFGDRPRVDAQCNGCQCSVVQSKRGVVASWKGGQRHFTVVGAQELDEAEDFIAHFQGNNRKA